MFKFATAAMAFVLAGLTGASALSAHAADAPVTIPDATALKWADTGPQFPNTRVVVLDGDASKRGQVVLRWNCPDQYKILPHTHPGTERVTVLQGSMKIGMGKKYDASALTEVKEGGYFVVPAGAPHFGDCVGDTVIHIHTDGPLGTTYVNAADDPSKKK